MTMRIDEVRFTSSGPEPVALFGKVHYFGPGQRRPAAVVCHPSSAGECDLEHPFVVEVCRALNDSGFVTFRFNFRGNKPSEGTLTCGKEEPGDLRAALDYLSQREDVDDQAIYAIGHSFGSAMALRAAVEDGRLQGVVASGFPARLGMPEASLNFTYYSFDGEGLRRCTLPKLFIRGSGDKSCPREKLEAMVAQLPEPKAIVEVPDADHFFRRVGRRGVVPEIVQETAQIIRSVVVGWSQNRR
ncbi:MAG: alpha/beta fold hydrolase [Dehalococcoidia bacterium]|nr:alpha/beta fold hydrolase [Dehalococcoidia bacterium]